VIEEKDVDHSIYEVPLDLANQELDVYVLEKLGLHVNRLRMTDWKKMVGHLIEPENGEITIAVVGKYIALQDSYKSIYEALTHGGIANSVKVNLRRLESEDIEAKSAARLLKGVDGILVPGGFGGRGIEGKIKAIQYAREHRIPFFGICLGMQCAVMEFARNVCEMKKANSTEFKNGLKYPVIALMDEQKKITAKGGTMRLGCYPCKLQDKTNARAAYKRANIKERHRHRYEFNNEYRIIMEEYGLTFSGLSPDGTLVEIIELKDHPWFVACQFHPEFQSTPLKAHPLFRDFIATAMNPT
ncbi:MAG: CTP synthase, partial [Spirochaetales bacterium]|nr:CTP synthase [Spirochaetales bacterium]